jgi:hypothetical protein
VAENVAQNNIKIKIGATTLRVLTLEQLSAFQPGTEYRVYYLAGPVPTILSAEVVGSEALTDGLDEPALEADAAHQAQMQTFKRGYAIVIVIGVLALAIPAAILLAPSLPVGLRGIVWVALGVVAIGFVPFALWWLRPRQRKQ